MGLSSSLGASLRGLVLETNCHHCGVHLVGSLRAQSYSSMLFNLYVNPLGETSCVDLELAIINMLVI